MPTYYLVNPYIKGKIKKSCEAKTPEKAASSIWEKLSKYMTNDTPKFAFTLMEKDKSLYHFLVEENEPTKANVEFNIITLDLGLTKVHENKFIDKIQEVRNKLKEEDEEPLSEKDQELYNKIVTFKKSHSPIKHIWYNPTIYTVCKTCKIESLFVPSFGYPVLPYIEYSLFDIFKK